MTAPRLKFLVCDPLEGVQVFARRLLEAYGFDAAAIRCCGDPATALSMGLQEPPDFLLTDWFGSRQPSGLQLYQQLRAARPGCLVGFLSFDISPEIEAAAQAVGSRFLLKKPFGPDDLKRQLQQTFATMAHANPRLMARVATESRGRLDTTGGRRIELPPVPPPLLQGQTVRMAGRSYKVMAVVIRHGEQLAQLDGVPALVPASQLSR